MENQFKCRVVSPVRYFGKRYEVGSEIDLTQKQIDAFGFTAVEKVLKSEEVIEIIPFEEMNEDELQNLPRKQLNQYAADLGMTKKEINYATNKADIVKLILTKSNEVE